jgi:hypothetical protein
MSTTTRRARFLYLTQELMGPVGHFLVAGAVTGRIPPLVLSPSRHHAEADHNGPNRRSTGNRTGGCNSSHINAVVKTKGDELLHDSQRPHHGFM